MKYEVRLTQIRSTHNNVRTPKIDGVCQHLPEVGQFFIMVGPPLDPAASQRYLRTSYVQRVEEDEENVYFFDTENSRYKLEVLETYN